MTQDFFENYARSLHEKINDLGASFKITIDDPSVPLLENGYTQLEKISIIEKAVMFETPDLPDSMLEELRGNLPKGYDIYMFEF